MCAKKKKLFHPQTIVFFRATHTHREREREKGIERESYLVIKVTITRREKFSFVIFVIWSISSIGSNIKHEELSLFVLFFVFFFNFFYFVCTGMDTFILYFICHCNSGIYCFLSIVFVCMHVYRCINVLISVRVFACLFDCLFK